MPTLVLNAYSKPYPTITNRIRASVFKQNSTAIIASLIDTTSGHPTRIWSFPGLPRQNYGFSLDEIDGSGNVVRNLASFDVIPGQIDGFLTRNDEQIKADTTPGFSSGNQVFTFDGGETSPSSGIFRPNYIGWEIVPSELTGRGILVRGKDYSWDSVTGIFTLLISGDFLPPNVEYNIHFNPVQNPAGNSYPTVNDFEISVETVGRNLLPDDFGKKILIEHTVDYVEFTFPDPTSVTTGRKLMIETKKIIVSDVNYTGFYNVKFKPFGSETIAFNRGNIYMSPGESISVYLFERAPGTFEWRVCDVYGNFFNTGDFVNSDITILKGIINKVPALGFSLNKNKFARLYNDFVLKLDISQVVNFDDWTTTGNTSKFSLANSANPANANLFKIPSCIFSGDMAVSYAAISGTISTLYFDTGIDHSIISRYTNKYILI